MKTTLSLPRLLLPALALCLTLMGTSQRAEAGLEIYGDLVGGGMYGTPTIGGLITSNANAPAGTANQGADFFVNQSGGLLGGKVGLKLFVIDVYLQFDQFFNGAGAAGSVLQPMLGWNGSFGCGGQQSGCWAFLLGLDGGGVFGFPYTPQFPIDKSEIATKGVAAEGQLGAEYRINQFMRLHLYGTIGYHYLFSGAAQVTIDNNGNVAATSTQGFHLLGKAALRFRLGVL